MYDIASFVDLIKNDNIKHSILEPMCKHTTFKTGGCADVFVEVKDVSELKKTICFAKKTNTPFFILGRGSNLLVADKGIRGAVISLANLNDIKIEENEIRCSAGASLNALCNALRDRCFSGLEFAYGIPGTVGGAVYMNAGAYGGEMADVLKSVTAIDNDGNIITLSKEDMCLGYRTSVFRSKGYTVIEAVFNLKKGEKADICAVMEDLMSRRRQKQPLNFPSAGSTFKRPEGYFAGALIEKNSLKGYRIGGAMVSELHAGFIINYENASSEDIIRLMRYVQETVYKNDGVLLEPEVLILGEAELLPYKTAEEIKKD